MEITLTTNRIASQASLRLPLTWKSWQESKARFFAGVALLSTLIVYAVFTSSDFLARYNARFPMSPLSYSDYIWSGLFHYALQGLWLLAAFVLCLGGLYREKATGAALYSLGLPARRLHLFGVRALVASVQGLFLALISSVLIALLSRLIGSSYSLFQSLTFGTLMGVAGLVFIAFGLLLSEIFSGEFTAPVLGLCSITAIFFAYKGHVLHRWNIFDTMSAANYVDPSNKLLQNFAFFPSALACVFISLVLFVAGGAIVHTRDF
ncbi:hypothetical protein [Terriglobus albidus]|uniref:hypothetical protein n=1 Tax=Terriglobus albidus TaxID=1592106 RepID=UPI0021DF47D8|nr:hypothetical protein [Terriglobus albidus]